MGNKQGSDGNKGSSNNQNSSKSNEDEVQSVQDYKVSTPPAISLPQISFQCDIGGGKGWPSDANIVLYHNEKGVIIAGTESGTLYIYGDGFQSLQPPLGEQIDITFIVPLLEERILISYDDNSLAVLEVSSLQLCHRLQKSWLHPACGDITAIHIDEMHQRSFAFIGTSEGYVRVVETLPTFRECDYVITSANSGLPEKMAVSQLQICPKEEKYLAIAYDGAEPCTGAVVVFDLVKNKTFRMYKTDAVTSLAWSHDGEMLFAGTRQGDVLSLGLDKAFSVVVWNASSELLDPSSEADNSQATIIRKISFMAPQFPSTQGCLFALLGAFGTETSPLRSVIVGLSVVSPQGQAQQVLSVPPLGNDADVIGFRIVPTCDKQANNQQECSAVVPGLLLLTQSTDGDATERQLRIIRCPDSNLAEWALEVGLMPTPREATEVLPGKSLVTAIHGVCPSKLPNTIADIVSGMGDRFDGVTPLQQSLKSQSASPASAKSQNIANSASDRPTSRRLSARDFFSASAGQLDVSDLDVQDSWEMVLASGARPEVDSADIVFVGHADGTIVAWGVSLPDKHDGRSGRNSCWVPLTTIRCNYSPVSIIRESVGMLLVGDESGCVVAWAPGPLDDTRMKSLTLEERLRVNVNSKVTSIQVVEECTMLVVGTEEGSVLVTMDWSVKELNPIRSLERCGASGAVANILVSSFFKAAIAPCLYVTFESGHVAIVHLYTQLVLAIAVGPRIIDLGNADDNGDDSEEDTFQRKVLPIVFSCVLDGNGDSVGSSISADSEHDDNAFEVESPSPTRAGEEATSAPPPHVSVSGVSSFVHTFKNVAKKKSKSDDNAISQPSKSSNTVTIVSPEKSPKHFVYICGKYLVSFDIAKFSAAKSSTGSVPVTFAAPTQGLYTTLSIAVNNIIAANSVSYIHEASRLWAKPIPCVSVVDERGDFSLISLKQPGDPIGQLSVLPFVLSSSLRLDIGLVLPNGDIFATHDSRLILSAAPSSDAYIPTANAPSRASTEICPPNPSHMLSVGPKLVDKTGAAKAKRRSSFLMAATITDLDKVFIKTWDQHQREELFRGAKLSEDEDDGGISSEKVKYVTNVRATGTKQALNETRDNFAERGERLERINQKMENIQENAKIYRADAAAHKEKMRKKAQKWGFF